MIKNVVFDLGGVLIDWNPRYLYKDIFKSQQEMEYFLQYVCSPEWNDRIDQGLAFETAIEERIQSFPQYSREIKMYFSQWPKMLNGHNKEVVSILSDIKNQNAYKLYVLSNWSQQTFPIALNQFEFLKLFDDYVISGQVNCAKPNPKIFQLLTDKFEIKPHETVFIDDKIENVKAALDLNFIALYFQNHEILRIQLNQLGILTFLNSQDSIEIK